MRFSESGFKLPADGYFLEQLVLKFCAEHDETLDLKRLYEEEIAKLRSQLDEVFAEKNAQELSSNKHIVLSAELENKLLEEVAVRRKLEAALGETHRLLAEKDAAIAELHISLSEHKQGNADLAKEKDGLQAFSSNLQEMHDNEATKRTEVEGKLATLQDQCCFDKEMFNKEIAELQNRVNAADMAIKIAEDRLKEHDMIDDQLAATLAKVKQQSHSELLRFQEEAEYSYLASLTSIKNQLDTSAKNHSVALEENIHLKAMLDDLTGEVKKEQSKSSAFEGENKALIKTAEIERGQFANASAALEARIRNLQEDVNTKIRELSAAYNSNIPVDVEIEAFSGLLDAEERRLQLSLTNPAPEIISRVGISRPHTGNRSLISRGKYDPIGVPQPCMVPVGDEEVPAAVSPTSYVPPAKQGYFPPLTPKGSSSSAARARNLYNMQQKMSAKMY
jgi:chromosome segregation ATPase